VDDDVETAVWLLRGAWVTMLLRAACRLGVFDQLATPRSAAEIARTVGAEGKATERFLRSLVDLGLAERGGDTYVASAVGSTFGSQHPSRVRDLVLMQTDLPTVAAWHDLDRALCTGEGVFELVNGRSHWDYMSTHPEVERTFNAAMARRGATQASMLLESVEFDGVSTMVDVGGGRGAMLAALLAARPALTGMVADRPAVAEEATDFLAAAGLGERARGVGCDFFTSVPSGADVYTMAHVLHDWTDGECVAILRTIRAAMRPDARLWVVERVLDAPGRTPVQQRDLHLMDLHMLVLFGARERAQAEYDALLAAAGFSPSRLGGTGDWNVLETRPVPAPTGVAE
jgi:hypothetical protein